MAAVQCRLCLRISACTTNACFSAVSDALTSRSSAAILARFTRSICRRVASASAVNLLTATYSACASSSSCLISASMAMCHSLTSRSAAATRSSNSATTLRRSSSSSLFRETMCAPRDTSTTWSARSSRAIRCVFSTCSAFFSSSSVAIYSGPCVS